MSKACPAALQEEAFALYSSTRYTKKEIAKRLGISPHTITEWGKRYGWLKRKQALARRMKQESDETSLQLQQKHRARVISRDIEISDMINDTVRDQIEAMVAKQMELLKKCKEKESMTLDEMNEMARITLSLSRSAKTGTDISARAVALDSRKENEKGSRKGMMFMGPVQMNIAGERITQGAKHREEDRAEDAITVYEDFPDAD